METLTSEYFSQKKLRGMIRPVIDALYVLNGKWKLPILITLTFSNRRFGELAKDIPKITDRMLSRELRELETNLLVTKVFDTNSTKALYTITDHGKSLHDVIVELNKWGNEHRKAIVRN